MNTNTCDAFAAIHDAAQSAKPRRAVFNAAEEAIPYQTLMASVLHKCVTGRLVETPAQRNFVGG